MLDSSLTPSLPATPTQFNFTEQATYEKGFNAYFNEKIKPVLQQLDLQKLEIEKKIEKAKPTANLILGGCLILGLIATYFTKSLGFLIILVIIGLSIKYIMAKGPIGELAEAYKNQVVPLIIKFFGEYTYLAQYSVNVSELTKTGLFEDFNQGNGEDHVSGTINNRNFSFYEARLIYRSGKHAKIVFNGLVIQIQLNNKYSGQTIIKRESDKGLWTWLTGKSHGLKNYQTTDPDFEKNFEVYTSDLTSAPTLLTPAIIKKIQELNQLYPHSEVRAGFYDDQLLISIKNLNEENKFESPGISNLKFDEKDLHLLLEQTYKILEIVKLFSKN